MENRWELTEDVREKYVPIIKDFLSDLDCGIGEGDLVLTNTELNPYTLKKLLEEEFDYIEVDTETNGWQMDFWIEMGNESYPSLHITGCGITFELFLRENV